MKKTIKNVVERLSDGTRRTEQIEVNRPPATPKPVLEEAGVVAATAKLEVFRGELQTRRAELQQKKQDLIDSRDIAFDLNADLHLGEAKKGDVDTANKAVKTLEQEVVDIEQEVVIRTGSLQRFQAKVGERIAVAQKKYNKKSLKLLKLQAEKTVAAWRTFEDSNAELQTIEHEIRNNSTLNLGPNIAFRSDTKVVAAGPGFGNEYRISVDQEHVARLFAQGIISAEPSYDSVEVRSFVNRQAKRVQKVTI